MSCDFYSTKLSKYIDNELSTSETADLERHIADCTACREELDTLKKNEDMLSDAFQVHPFGKELAKTVAARMPGRGFVASRRVQYAVFAAAACILVVLGIFISTGSRDDARPLAMQPYSNDSDEAVEIEIASASVTMNRGTLFQVEKTDEATVLHLEKGQVFVATMPNKSADYVVKTLEAVMRPLGTKFDVQRFERGGLFVTVLSVIEGEVRMETKKSAVTVKADEQMKVGNGNDPQAGTKGSAHIAAGWYLGTPPETTARAKPAAAAPSTGSKPGTDVNTPLPPGGFDYPVTPDEKDENK